MKAQNSLADTPWTSHFATTLSSSQTSPSVPRNLAASVVDTISLLTDDVELTWDAPTDGTTPFTYRVERASDSLFTQHTRTIANNLVGPYPHVTGILWANCTIIGSLL